MKYWCQKTSTETKDYKFVIWNKTRHKNNPLQKNPSKRAAASKEQSSFISNNISKLSENQKANRQGNGLKSSLKLQRQKFETISKEWKRLRQKNQISTKSENFKAFDYWICLSFGEVKTLWRRHRKNCECCPGLSLPASH